LRQTLAFSSLARLALSTKFFVFLFPSSVLSLAAFKPFIATMASGQSPTKNFSAVAYDEAGNKRKVALITGVTGQVRLKVFCFVRRMAR